MGKGRAPCCDKSKVKKGPWSPAEDLRLITFIQKHGHDNWRALPKQAGLLRCGKSCRLRWINYLRPDVKRGNFTEEEEETIIKLHQSLGNKWSKIASHLPGRTDNEIKNVWNTHLKKSLASNVKIKSQVHHSPTYGSPSSSSSDAISLSDDQINDSQTMDRDPQDDHLADKSSVSKDSPIQKPVLSNEIGGENMQEQEMFGGCNFGSNESFRSSVSQELNLSNSPQDDDSRMMSSAAATLTTTTTPTTTITNERIGSSLDFTALWEEVNKPIESEEFPIGFQDDIDIDWNMLWSIEDICQSGDTCQVSMSNGSSSNTICQYEFGGNGSEVDNNKWLSYLENELGLID